MRRPSALSCSDAHWTEHYSYAGDQEHRFIHCISTVYNFVTVNRAIGLKTYSWFKFYFLFIHHQNIFTNYFQNLYDNYLKFIINKTLFVPGDKVAIEEGVPCRICDFCKEGKYNLCPNLAFTGLPPHHGNITQYRTHTADFCHKYVDIVWI